MQGRSDNRQLVLAILGGAAGVALLLASLVLLSGRDGTGAAGASGSWGWAIPLASLFVLVGVTWLLLSQKPQDPRSGPQLYEACPSCDRSVMRDWRLCPYCGELLESRDTDRVVEGA